MSRDLEFQRSLRRMWLAQAESNWQVVRPLSMKWWLGPLALVGLSCTRASEPFQMPTGRMLSGLVRCDAEQQCDAGTCFISLFDKTPTCTGAGKSPCDVMQCDAPAQCKCLQTTPPQCGCAVTFGAGRRE